MLVTKVAIRKQLSALQSCDLLDLIVNFVALFPECHSG